MKWYEIVVGIIAWLAALWFYGYLRESYVRGMYGYPMNKKEKPFRESIIFKVGQYFKLKLYRKYFWFIIKK